MKILLSSSVKHFNPITKKVVIRHSVGVCVELFSSVLEELGEVTYIGDNDLLEGQDFDLIVSWPRNFEYLTTHNKFKKSVCFFNIAEPVNLKHQMLIEAGRLGCKLSDCFTPRGFYNADLNFLIGDEVIKKQYEYFGVKNIVNLYYRHGYIPFKKHDKTNTFIHIATTLGLRKGFWHVVEDFKKANIDAKLLCIGRVQNERFWIDYARSVNEDPRIEVVGWVENSDKRYIDLINNSDFIVFPSFGEGQPGSVIEAMEGGCLPMTTIESGIPYYPLGIYNRGDTYIWHKAFSMTNEEFGIEQDKLKTFVDEKYNNEVFKNTVREEISKLW